MSLIYIVGALESRAEVPKLLVCMRKGAILSPLATTLDVEFALVGLGVVEGLESGLVV